MNRSRLKPIAKLSSSRMRLALTRRVPGALLALLVSAPASAHASFFKGDTLDTAADVLAWVVLVIVPIVGISVFWLVHILPEKIAEKKQHPQTKAIQTLCLLSLVFGGLLWPFAWLWAYTKPVLYRMAYGTDKVPHSHEEDQATTDRDKADEIEQHGQHVVKRESNSTGNSAAKEGGV
jgi:CBS domain containing-hemolysin-like protein